MESEHATRHDDALGGRGSGDMLLSSLSACGEGVKGLGRLAETGPKGVAEATAASRNDAFLFLERVDAMRGRSTSAAESEWSAPARRRKLLFASPLSPSSHWRCTLLLPPLLPLPQTSLRDSRRVPSLGDSKCECGLGADRRPRRPHNTHSLSPSLSPSRTCFFVPKGFNLEMKLVCLSSGCASSSSLPASMSPANESSPLAEKLEGRRTKGRRKNRRTARPCSAPTRHEEEKSERRNRPGSAGSGAGGARPPSVDSFSGWARWSPTARTQRCKTC